MRWGLGEQFTNYVASVYEKAKTLVEGVTQCGTLSPLLFNITLDQALSTLPREVDVVLWWRGGGQISQLPRFR